MSLKVRSGEFGSPEDVKPLPRSAAREGAIESAKIFQADARGNGIEDVKELRAYNREKRGEAALEAALERGRNMRDSAVEKAAPILSSLRSRITNYASRALSLFKTSIGFGAEVKDASVEGLKRSVDLVAPFEALSAETQEKIAEIEQVIEDNEEVVARMRPGNARNALIEEIQELQREKAALQATSRKVRPGIVKAAKVAGAVATSPVTVPLAAGAGLYAGGKAGYNLAGRGLSAGKEYAGGKLNAAGEYINEKIEGAKEYAVDTAVAGAEYAMEKESTYQAVGLIAGEALSKILGKDVKLSYAQAMALGAALESSGIAAKLMSSAVDSAKGLAQSAENGATAVRELYQFLANPETRGMLIDILKDVGVDLKDVIEAKARSVGAKAMTGAKNTAKVAGVGAASYAAGSVGVAAAPAALSMAMAAAPVVLPIAAGGAAVAAAGYGAYRAGKAGAQMAQEKWAGLEPKIQQAVNEAAAEAERQWKAAEPQIQAAIELAVREVQNEWKRREPSIIDGIASTVAPAVELAMNFASAPADLKKEYQAQMTSLKTEATKASAELNRIGQEAVTFVERMQKRAAEAMDIARKAWNEMRRLLVSEEVMAENPAVVAGIDRALDALEEIEELPDSAIAALAPEDAPEVPLALRARSGGVVPVRRPRAN